MTTTGGFARDGWVKRHALPTVRVLEAIEPILLGYSYEIRVELVEVDGIRRIRVRAWERVPHAEDVERHVAAIRQLIASLVASTVTDTTAECFIREASGVVGAYLQSGGSLHPVRSLNFAIVPAEIVGCTSSVRGVTPKRTSSGNCVCSLLTPRRP